MNLLPYLKNIRPLKVYCGLLSNKFTFVVVKETFILTMSPNHRQSSMKGL